jgi:hypothetical protein
MRKHHSNKIRVLVVGLLMLVIAIAVLYIFLPINDKPLSNYYGWSNYCNNSTNICFKYPRSWKELNQHGMTTFKSSNNTEQISYVDGSACEAVIELGTTYVVSIDNLSTNPKVSVVGLVIDNAPQYTLVNTSDLNQYNLHLNKEVTGNINYCFNFDRGSSILATPNTNYNLSSAKAWFKTKDAKTALLSLESVSFY